MNETHDAYGATPRRPDDRARFHEYELDLRTCELTRRGSPVQLRPLAGRALAALVQRSGRVMTRAELRRELWGDDHVDWQAGLHQCVRQIRRSLGDDARQPRFVETVPRVGYRFIAPLTTPGGPVPAASSAASRGVSWGSFLSGVAATLAVPSVIVALCALLA